MAGELTVNECGVSWDVTFCMVARLRRAADPPSQRGTAGGAGQKFCVACQLGGCYAIQTRCFRCGIAMSGSAPNSWPLPPRLVHNRRQPRITSGLNFTTAPTFRPPRNEGNKQPNPGASVQIQQLVDMLSQIGCSSEVMTEVRNRVSGLASPGDSAADKQRRSGDLLDRQGWA